MFSEHLTWFLLGALTQRFIIPPVTRLIDWVFENET